MVDVACKVRSIVGVVLVVVATVAYACVVVPRLWLFPSVAFADRVTRSWSALILGLFNVRLTVEGLEHLPPGGSIMIFNHCSFFDIPVLFRALPASLRFGAKAELFKIPFFGPALRVIGILPIVRSDRDKVIDIYRRSIDRVRAGETMVLAPEGTRQSGESLGAFKSGPFIFAMEGRLPLTPVLIFGAHRVMARDHTIPMWSRWQETVHVQVLAPIPTVDWDLERRPELQERTRRMMNDAYLKKMKDTRG